METCTIQLEAKIDDKAFVLYLLRKTFHKVQSSTMDTEVGKNLPARILYLKKKKENDNIAPDLFKSYFIKFSHVYSTRRNGLDILIPKVRTKSAKKGTSYTGTQVFNNLPPHLMEVDSIVIFKTQLNDIIF